MADDTVPVPYPNTPATTEGAVPTDRKPSNMQQTNPTKGAHDPVPEIRHATDDNDEIDKQTDEER